MDSRRANMTIGHVSSIARSSGTERQPRLRWTSCSGRSNYLHRIKKGSIAGRLERNRSQILKQVKPG